MTRLTSKKIKTKHLTHLSTLNNEDELFPDLVLNPSDNDKTNSKKQNININIIKNTTKKQKDGRELF